MHSSTSSTSQPSFLLIPSLPPNSLQRFGSQQPVSSHRETPASRYIQSHTDVVWRHPYRPQHSNLFHSHVAPSPSIPTILHSNTIIQKSDSRLQPNTVTLVSKPLPLQVVVDLDDTLVSSGGQTILQIPIGGIDTQYRRGQIYPGCCLFVYELARHNLLPGEQPLTLAVLTARIPQTPIDESHVLNRRLASLGKLHGHDKWGIGVSDKIMYSTLGEWVFPSRKASRKYEGFVQLYKYMSRQIRGLEYVWIGDTGELDRIAGETIAKSFPKALKAIFLHIVGEEETNDVDYLVNGVPVFHFKTYVMAAKKAFDVGLIDIQGLLNVSLQVIIDLQYQKTNSTISQWMDVLYDFQIIKFKFNWKAIGGKYPKLINTLNSRHTQIFGVPFFQ